MKRFLSLFVALAMVLSLFAGVGARSAKAATTYVSYKLDHATGATSTWDATAFHLGEYSVKLVQATTAGSTHVEFALDGTITLADLDDITTTSPKWSFWSKSADLTAGDLAPQLELRFTAPTNTDPDGAGHVDVTLMPASTDTAWVERKVVPTTPAVFMGNNLVGGTAFGDATHYTLSQVVALIEAADTTTTTTGTWKLTRVRVELYNASSQTACVDDVTIDGTTYGLEPITAVTGAQVAATTHVKLTWTNLDADAAYYKIYRNQTGTLPIFTASDTGYDAVSNPVVTPIITVAAATGTYTDITTAANQTYYYWFYAIDDSGSHLFTSPSQFVAVVTTTATGRTPLTIVVTPAAHTVHAGAEEQFYANGTYATSPTTEDITDSVTWSVTGGSTFSDITPGLLTGGSVVGGGYITAKLGAISGFTTITVDAAVRTLQYITITPNPVTLTGAQQFVATANYNTAPLTEVITDSVTWARIPTTLGTFSTVTDGLFTAAATTTIVGGYITAALGGITGYATVTNNTTAATTLSIKTLGGLTSPAYVEEGKTIQLVAVDQTGAVATPSWTSGSIAVATVGATTGLVLAVTDAGVSVITATLGSVTSTFVVVAIPVQTITSLAVKLVPAGLAVSGKQQIGAIAANAAYSTLDYTTQAAWIDDLAVASVSNTAGKQGLLTFSTAETGHVYASAGGFTATGTVTIDAAGVLTMTTVVAPVTRVIALTVGTDIVTIDGKATSVDAAPEIVNGRTFVPIRFIAETFGSTVTWLPETRGVTITLGTTTIGLQIGNKTVVINTKIIALEAAPYIKNSRTMVPLRVISESFGGDVAWDGVNKIITITYLLP